MNSFRQRSGLAAEDQCSMLSAMAATTGRLIALAVGFLLAITACSNTDDDIDAELDAAAEAAETSSTTTTTRPSTTTTSEPTSTTLSELDAAEAEIRQVVIGLVPVSDRHLRGRRHANYGSKPLTGLLRQRVLAESDVSLCRNDGVIRRIDRDPAPIEIVEVSTIDNRRQGHGRSRSLHWVCGMTNSSTPRHSGSAWCR